MILKMNYIDILDTEVMCTKFVLVSHFYVSGPFVICGSHLHYLCTNHTQ